MNLILLFALFSVVSTDKIFTRYQYTGPCKDAATILNSMASIVIERTNEKRPNQIAEVVSFGICQWCGCCPKDENFNECKADTCEYIRKLLKPFNTTLEVIPASESWTRFEAMHYSMRLFNNQKCG